TGSTSTLAFAGETLDRDLLMGARGGGGGGRGGPNLTGGKPYFRPGDTSMQNEQLGLFGPEALLNREKVAPVASLAIQGDLSHSEVAQMEPTKPMKDEKTGKNQTPAPNSALAINQVQIPVSEMAPTTQPIIQATIRKVIREGVMEFEVDSFDSAFST